MTYSIYALLDPRDGSVHYVGATSQLIATDSDSILWYAKDKQMVKFRSLYLRKKLGSEGAKYYDWAEHVDTGEVTHILEFCDAEGPVRPTAH